MPDISNLESTIGYYFNNKDLLKNALTHSSYASEHKYSYNLNNERLEFIGDAYLDAVIGMELYRVMPKAHEGVLSRTRSNVVCEEALAEVARHIHLGDYMMLGKGEQNSGGNNKDSILSDAFEALLGAIILDGGYDSCKLIIINLLSQTINDAVEGKLNKDYKSQLQETLQNKYKNVQIKYLLTSESGPDHNKTFNVSVFVNGNEIGCGTGKSKLKAEQAAAHDVIMKGEI